MRPGLLVRSVACAPLLPRRCPLPEVCAAGLASTSRVTLSLECVPLVTWPRRALCHAVVGGALPCGLPLGCAGPPLTRLRRVVGSTCGSVALFCVMHAATCLQPLTLLHSRLVYLVRCAPQVAQGVVCLFFQRGDWRTEGAQGVLTG